MCACVCVCVRISVFYSAIFLNSLISFKSFPVASLGFAPDYIQTKPAVFVWAQ